MAICDLERKFEDMGNCSHDMCGKRDYISVVYASQRRCNHPRCMLMHLHELSTSSPSPSPSSLVSGYLSPIRVIMQSCRMSYWEHSAPNATMQMVCLREMKNEMVLKSGEDTLHISVAVDAIDTVSLGRRFELLSVKFAAACPQALCSLFRSDVTLGLGHHLVADLELADCGASQ